MSDKVTKGFLLAIETWRADKPDLPDPYELAILIKERLNDMGWVVEGVSVESMGEIDCYEEEKNG